MAWLAILAATEGRRPGFTAVAGVALGLSAVGLAAALGVAALVSASEPAYQALRWAGVLYLLWLAWDGWRGGEAGDHAPFGASMWRYFRRGLITNLLNPKAAAFYLTVLPTFLTAQGDALRETLVLTAVYVVVATGVHGAIVAAAGAARALFADPVAERRLRRVLSTMLALVALWFAWKTGR